MFPKKGYHIQINGLKISKLKTILVYLCPVVPALMLISVSEVKWQNLGQFRTQQRLYSNISPLIFICGIFIVSNHRFMVLYYGLLLITMRGSLRIIPHQKR